MNIEGVTIREFQFQEDYSNVRRLWETAGDGIHVRRSDEPDEIQKKILRDPELFLIAEFNKRIIGSVLGGYDGRRGMVYHLAVDSDFRRLGIGGLLMATLEDRLKDKGCLRTYLLVTKDNYDAIKFYEERGWTKLELYVYGKDLE